MLGPNITIWVSCFSRRGRKNCLRDSLLFCIFTPYRASDCLPFSFVFCESILSCILLERRFLLERIILWERRHEMSNPILKQGIYFCGWYYYSFEIPNKVAFHTVPLLLCCYLGENASVHGGASLIYICKYHKFRAVCGSDSNYHLDSGFVCPITKVDKKRMP